MSSQQGKEVGAAEGAARLLGEVLAEQMALHQPVENEVVERRELASQEAEEAHPVEADSLGLVVEEEEVEREAAVPHQHWSKWNRRIRQQMRSGCCEPS